jgi:hypothetical protein
MNFKSLQRKAKQLIDRRGGPDSLKADAEELKDIAKGPGSLADKAKRAGDALKDPGGKGPDTPQARTRPPPTSSPRRSGPLSRPPRPRTRPSPTIRPAPKPLPDNRSAAAVCVRPHACNDAVCRALQHSPSGRFGCSWQAVAGVARRA